MGDSRHLERRLSRTGAPFRELLWAAWGGCLGDENVRGVAVAVGDGNQLTAIEVEYSLFAVLQRQRPALIRRILIVLNDCCNLTGRARRRKRGVPEAVPTCKSEGPGATVPAKVVQIAV
jgi:hypothetical protein